MNKIIAIFAACLVTACTSIQQGTPFTKNDINSFKEGVTTNDQVRTKLGIPNGISHGNNGEEIWSYSFSESKSNGAEWIPVVGAFATKTNSISRNAQLIFTSDGILKNVSYAESKGGSETKL